MWISAFDGNRIRWKSIRLLEITQQKFYKKLKKDDGLDEDNDHKNTLPSQLGAFIVSKIAPIMKNFIREINGFYNFSIFFGDTD